MIDYYDRAGNPLTLNEWVALTQRYDMDYKRVAVDTVGEAYTVSTVWLGLNHEWREGHPPLIFETMTFTAESYHDPDSTGLEDVDELDHDGDDFYSDRYSTEAEALEGHRAIVAKLRERASRVYRIETHDSAPPP